MSEYIEDHKLLRRQAAAKQLGIGVDQIQALIDAGQLRTVVAGKSVYVSMGELRRFTASGAA